MRSIRPSTGGWPNLTLYSALQGAPLKLCLGGGVELSQNLAIGNLSFSKIESQWTERRREGLGIIPTFRIRSANQNPAQAKLERAP
jgi:hypothetical protein